MKIEVNYLSANQVLSVGDGSTSAIVVANALFQTLTDPKRRAEFEKDIPAVYEMLRKGCEEARAVAAETLSEVRRAMKINYFDDAALIAGQADKYAQE